MLQYTWHGYYRFFAAMNAIFLDIGSHLGETLEEVCNPAYFFDRIYAFEPSPRCHAHLSIMAERDPRLRICPFGLGSENHRLVLHSSGSSAATTICSELDQSPADSLQVSDDVEIRNVSEWIFENLDPSDLIVGKINCEGGEIAILEDLLSTGALSYFYSLVVSFDIRRFPQLRSQEGVLRSKLRRSGLNNVCYSDDVIIGPTHHSRISNWLQLFGLKDAKPCSVEDLRTNYSSTLKYFSRKRGYFPRIESYLKHVLGYKDSPDSIKTLLRATKTLFGLNKERIYTSSL